MCSVACEEHAGYTRHKEEKYTACFNGLMDAILEKWPGAIVYVSSQARDSLHTAVAVGWRTLVRRGASFPPLPCGTPFPTLSPLVIVWPDSACGHRHVDGRVCIGVRIDMCASRRNPPKAWGEDIYLQRETKKL